MEVIKMLENIIKEQIRTLKIIINLAHRIDELEKKK